MSPVLFAALVAAAIFAGLFAVGAIVMLAVGSRSSARLQRRLTPVAAAGDEFSGQTRGPLLHSMARGGKALETMVDPKNESGRLLLQTGWRSGEARVGWYVFQTILPIVLGSLVLAFIVFADVKNKGLYVLALAFAAVALSFLMPRWILRGFAERRQRRIKNEVPLFLHLLVLLFEAGLSTRQAFASLVREGKGVLPELGREFEGVLRQLEAGGDTAEVLRSLGDVLDVEDLTGVLGVLRQVDRYGGEVREPLLEALSVLEERRGLDMREKVNLMSGRMTVVMVLFFFPALLVFVAGPAFLSIWRALVDVNAR